MRSAMGRPMRPVPIIAMSGFVDINASMFKLPRARRRGMIPDFDPLRCVRLQ
jgi:hypothetical protein